MKPLERHLTRVSNFSRQSKVILQLVSDIIVAFSCVPIALFLGGESLKLILNPPFFLVIIVSITSSIITYASFGLYRSLIRFITSNILIIIIKGVLVGSSIIILHIIITDVDIRLTVPIIYALVLFLSTGGIRFIVRLLFQNPNQKVKKPAVIYGAGKAGRELHNILLYNHEIQPVAFIDDNSSTHGLTIGGSCVYSRNSFAKIKKKYAIELVLLALPNISRRKQKEIINIFHGYNLKIKSIPPISNILSGDALLSELRPITPEMLLGRDQIAPIKELMQRNILGRTVMITGAGGSIGAEVCRQVLAQNPLKLILFELSEVALYKINEEMLKINKQTNNTTQIVPVLGSVQDKKRVTEIIKNFNITTIYHAAAYKHVPLLESNIIEGINNNVFGTLTLVQSAIKLGIDSFTLISTDKAVRPTNVMGASKRIAELICQAYAKEGLKTKFTIVRFGNVLGSSGSVIPLFQKQIELGGPITLTHPEITRYFMTIPEAAELVIQASSMSTAGEIFLLDMGEPIKISNLAAEMIKMAGLQPYFPNETKGIFSHEEHIAICVTGLRKGEKLYEELLISQNSKPTEHPRIMKAIEISLPMVDMTYHIKKLHEACKIEDLEAVVNILKEMPLEFNTKKVEPSDVTSINNKI